MNSPGLKVLFISRAYPPVVGGIEKQNHAIGKALGEIVHVEIIANRRGKGFLPVFMVLALFRALFALPKCDVVLLGDGVLSVLGCILKRLSGKPVVCILHGLDITYPNRIYQAVWVKYCLQALDRYIAVGNETIRQGVRHGLPEDRFVFIGNGVDLPGNENIHSKTELEQLLGRQLSAPVILTLGRLVRRKGVEWFVREVMPRLAGDIVYVIAGDGKERHVIQQAITECRLHESVVFLGEVSDAQKQILLSQADLFVQPNIPVPGDIEGFGLVVLEAAAQGCVVAASELEGLKDAIVPGENGILIPPGRADLYAETITRLLSDPLALKAQGERAKNYVQQHCLWSMVASRYVQVLQALR